MSIHARASLHGGAVRWMLPAHRRRQGCPRDIVRQLAAMLAARAAPFAHGSDGTHQAVTDQSAFIATGWDAIDRVLAPASPRDLDSDALAHVGMGGLQRGAVHEWLFGEHVPSSTARRRWLPSHSLFIHLAWRAIEDNESEDDSAGLIIWIGRRVWPQARALTFWILDFGFWNGKESSGRWPKHRSRHVAPDSNPFSASSVFFVANPSPIQNPQSKIPNSSLLSRSIFVDPPDDASRLWAIDLALRSPAASVVIADGSKLKMAESRRLQLAAERGRALGLLARPLWEGAELSAAATRWRVRRTPSPSFAPRWIVELLRCKQLQGCSGVQVSVSTGCGGAGAWEVEYVAPGCVRLVADVVDRSGSPPAEARVGNYARSLA